MSDRERLVGLPRRELAELAAIAIGLAVFLALACYQLHLPGLHYDEAREAGLPAMQLLRGLPVEAFRGAGIRLGGQLVPLMVVDYIGATNVVLELPFLAVGGINVIALRALPIALAVAALLLLYALARELYNRRVALIAFALLCVNPAFVFWSRQGIFVTSTIVPISLAAALCLVRWYRRGQRGYLWLGLFLLGLGLYTKFIFLWIVLGFACVFAVYSGGRLLSSASGHRTPILPNRVGVTDLVGSVAAFILGLLPLLIYNLQTGGTFGVIGQNLTNSYYGTNNLAFLQNLSTRLGQTQAVLSGSPFWYLGGVFENPVWPYAVVVALAATVVTVVLRARDEAGRAAIPWIVWAVVLLASCFTVSALWPTHYAILTPWPPLALAVAVDLVWRRWHGLSRLAWVAIVLVFALGALDIRIDLAYHRALAASGGLSSHSSAIYDLAKSLDERGLSAPAVMDWGIAAQTAYLTEGRVRPVEIFGYDWAPDEGFARRVRTFTANPDSVFIFHAPAETVFPRRDAFDALLREDGQTSTTETVLDERDGKPIFTLVRVAERPE